MKFHVHVYRVSEKLELNLDADTEAEAQSLALKAVKDGGGTVVTSDCSLIAMPFPGDHPI